MAIIFPLIYLSTTETVKPEPLVNVTAFKRGVRRVRTGTYRDLPSGVGTLKANVSNSATPEVNNLPVYAPAGTLLGNTNDLVLNSLRAMAGDDQTHTPPRYYDSLESGYLIAFGGVTIDPPQQVPDPPSNTVAITSVDLSTNICTANGHGFLNGDTAALVWTTLPTTVPVMSVATNLVRIIKVDDNRVLLKASTGVVLDINNAGAGLSLVLETSTKPVQIPADQEGVYFVPDSWKPHFSFDPSVTVPVFPE